MLATFTAAAYAELVTKYPRAGGAALYVDRAFRLPVLTFLVTFAVMASGISSASALARGFGGDYLSAFVEVPTVVVALIFIVVVARQLPGDRRVRTAERRLQEGEDFVRAGALVAVGLVLWLVNRVSGGGGRSSGDRGGDPAPATGD